MRFLQSAAMCGLWQRTVHVCQEIIAHSPGWERTLCTRFTSRREPDSQIYLPTAACASGRDFLFVAALVQPAARLRTNLIGLKLQRVPKGASRKRNKILVTLGFLRQDGIVFPVLCSTLERRAPIVAIQTRKPIEIDLSGIEIEGIQLFVQEGAHQIPAMELGTVPPCVYPCVVPPCAACGSAPSISAAK